MAYPFSYMPKLAPGRHRVGLLDIAEFSQPFEATYVNEAGLVVTVPPNTPRFEGGELLIERATSNIFAKPDDLADPVWIKADVSLSGADGNLVPDTAEPTGSGGGWTAGPDLALAGVVMGPTGSLDGSAYISEVAGANGLSWSAALDAATRYKFSVWARVLTGDSPSEGALMRASIGGEVLGGLTFAQAGVLGGWVRFFMDFTTGADGLHTIELGAGWANGANIAFAQPRLKSAPADDLSDLTPNDPLITTPDGKNNALKVARGNLVLSQAVNAVMGVNYAPSLWVYYPAGADTTVTIGDEFAVVSQPVRASASWQRLLFGAFTKVGGGSTVSIRCPALDAPLWLWWPQLEPGFASLAGVDADVAAFGGSWDFVGPNIVRVGTTLSPEGTMDAVVYQSSAEGNSFVGRSVVLEPLTQYRFSVWTRLVSGDAPTHRAALIVDSSNDVAPALAGSMRPAINAKPPGPEWAEQEITFTTAASIRDSFAYFAIDWETGAQVAYWRPLLTRISGVTPTSMVRTRRANDVAYLAEFVARHTPNMQPLRNSHEADTLESELKALFIDLLGQYVRPGERLTNTVGVPHIGGFSQVERAVSAEGLALQRRGDEAAMRYVFRSWRARNPKRGLHMLRTYLQLLWPNSWEMHQQWQKNGEPYTSELSDTDEGDHFLTSRVNVFVHTATTDGSDVASVAPSLRSVVPARIVLNVQVITRNQIDAGVCMAGAGALFHKFTGAFV